MLVLVVVVLVAGVRGFNVDTRRPVIQERPRGSCEQDCMFGFSVAQHTESGVPWVLVGAPRAESGQPGVHKGGAVYKCPALSQGGCQIIPFDTTGDTLTPQGKQYDIKSGQWFGSVLQSSGPDGTVLACAPRYVWFSRNFKRREPVGSCYTAKNNLGDFFEYSPCRTRKWGYHRQGSCQAGLGAAVAKNGDQIYIGAVGSWYWQGQVYSINTHDSGNMSSPSAGQAFSPNLAVLRNQRKTEEGNPQDDDSYLGYSLTTGEFNGDGDYMDVAVGMPRGANLTGKVVLYNSNLTNLNNLTGSQIGAYFGYCLGTSDLNGDGLDDLLIGSPMWTNYGDTKFETGRVYVVYQDNNHRFRKFDTLDGENHKARFGMAVASLGDINLDGASSGAGKGYKDIAVGAPYDGPNQRGAVYIFLGSADGVIKKPSQVIFARDLSPALRTFGWSISGGLDMDNNKYPDLLIGAYESGHAVHMMSAPVVHMVAEISFERDSKQIDLDRMECTLEDRKTMVPCVPVTVSLRYTGIGVPNKLEFELEYVLDSKKEKNKRMYFIGDETKTMRTTKIEMLKERTFKDRFKVFIPGSHIKDKLTSLEVQVRYRLADSASAGQGLNPVLGHGDHLAADSCNIMKECGADNICIPDLSIKTREVSSYLMGSGENLELQTEITNSGEDAFNALLEVQIPQGVNYVNANTGSSGISIMCSPPSARNNKTLQCEVGNPLRSGAKVSTSIILQPREEGLLEPISEFVFSMQARSSNPESDGNGGNNIETFRVPIRVETSFRVTGVSKPDHVTYNISEAVKEKYEVVEDIGEEVKHVYQVTNKGPSAINEAEVYILWPSFNDNGDDLLYLTGLYYDQAKATCEPVNNLNHLSLKTESRAHYSSQSSQASGGYIRQSSSSSSSSSSRSSSGLSSGSGSSSSTSYSSSSSSSSGSMVSGGGGGRGHVSGSGSHYESTYSGSGGQYGSNSGGSWGRYGSTSGGSGGGGQYGANNEVQYETSYGGSRQQGVYSGGQRQIIAEGAEETRLFDTQGRPFQEENKRLEVTNKQTSYSSNLNVISQDNQDDKSGGDVVYSGWRMLPNGTYIRVYDKSSKTSTASGSSTGSSQSSGSQEVRLTGGSSGSFNNVGDTGSIGGRQGQAYNSYESQSSYSSSASSSAAGGEGGSQAGGRINLPDGTWGRQSSTSSSSSSASFNRGGSGSSANRGGSGQSGGYVAENINLGETSNFNTIMNAAKGPGDYHGTMSKAELEREAGGAIFSENAGAETRHQVSTTQYQGSGAQNSYNQANTGSSSQYYGSGAQNSYNQANAGSNTQYQSGSVNSYNQANFGSQSSFSQANAGSNNYGSGADNSYNQANFGSNTQYQGTGNSYSQANAGSNTNNFGSRAQNNYNTVNAGSNSQHSASGSRNSYSEVNSGSNSQYSGSDSSYNEVNTGSSSGSGSKYSGEGEDYVTTARGRWVWSVEDKKWNWEEGKGAGGQTTVSQDSGSQDSGWTLLSNGTYVRKVSGWSSQSSSSGGAGGYAGSGGSSGYSGSSGTTETRGSSGSGGYSGSGGSGSGYSYGGDYFESGNLRQSIGDNSGSTDSGWVLLANGTYVRKQSSFSTSSGSSVRSGVGTGAVLPRGGSGEYGDEGNNSTGWIRQPDGTMVKKSSSWASWSSSSVGDISDDQLSDIQRRLEERAKNNINTMPGNVEPGFENQYRRRHRRKRDLAEFESELEGCTAGKCTVIKCNIGHLEKGKEVVFNVTSRLNTKTIIKNYAEKVQISSKMLIRVTKLPFFVEEEQLSYQLESVKTTVIPSEPGSAGTPWWVWLLAAIAGILVLALISYCLYKCGFFNRKRPDDSPEAQPLNGTNGY